MMADPIRPLVLVVEDDKDTRDMYAMYLDLSGVAVMTAANASAAFELALEHQPQIVVTDFRLAGPASGADLCRRLGSDERTAHIPALLLTGSTFQSDTDAAIDAGCAEVRIKPYLPDALLTDIREIISRSGQQPLLG